MAFLKCRIESSHNGTKSWIGESVVDGKNVRKLSDNLTVFNVFPRLDSADQETRIDMRDKAPFLNIIPCPHCGTEDDRKHDAMKHIDKRLGVCTACRKTGHSSLDCPKKAKAA